MRCFRLVLLALSTCVLPAFAAPYTLSNWNLTLGADDETAASNNVVPGFGSTIAIDGGARAESNITAVEAGNDSILTFGFSHSLIGGSARAQLAAYLTGTVAISVTESTAFELTGNMNIDDRGGALTYAGLTARFYRIGLTLFDSEQHITTTEDAYRELGGPATGVLTPGQYFLMLDHYLVSSDEPTVVSSSGNFTLKLTSQASSVPDAGSMAVLLTIAFGAVVGFRRLLA